MGYAPGMHLLYPGADLKAWGQKAMGHDARIATGLKRSLFGRGQVIQKLADKSGKTIWAAGSDPRADGHAAAQI